MWELDRKEGWVLKNCCFWTVVLEKTLESSLDCKEIQPVNPKGNQSWVFTGRTDAEAETPILWLPDAKNWLIGKDPDVGKDWRWEEKGTPEDEMVGWHHWLSGVWASSERWWRTGNAAVHGVAKTQTWLRNWTTRSQGACTLLKEAEKWVDNSTVIGLQGGGGWRRRGLNGGQKSKGRLLRGLGASGLSRSMLTRDDASTGWEWGRTYTGRRGRLREN